MLVNKFGSRFLLCKFNSNKDQYMTQFSLPGYDGMAYGFDKYFKTRKEALEDADKDE